MEKKEIRATFSINNEILYFKNFFLLSTIYSYDIKLLFFNSVRRILPRKMCKSVEKCSIFQNENPSGVYRNNVRTSYWKSW